MVPASWVHLFPQGNIAQRLKHLPGTKSPLDDCAILGVYENQGPLI